MAQLITVDEPVTESEQSMLNRLQQELPDSWYLIGNTQVSVGRRTREIDCIVIGQKGLWVIDAKGFGGLIRGDEQAWVLDNGVTYERVLDKVIHAASMVKGKVQRKFPHLRRIWVEALVVLTQGGVTLSIEDARVAGQVLLLDGCAPFLLKADSGFHSSLSEDTRLGLAELLAGRVAAKRTGSGGSKFAALQIDGVEGFRRVYYEDVVLDRNELRGIPIDRIPKGRLKISMEEGGIYIEGIGLDAEAEVGRERLIHGKRIRLGIGDSIVRIGALRLRATVFYCD
jgi:hypothetical protein